MKFLLVLLVTIASAWTMTTSAQAVSPQQVRAEQRFAQHEMLRQYGWRLDEFHCLDVLWGHRESGWDPKNVNSSSGANGIPQRLGNGEMPENWWDPRVQIRWGLRYISGRYRTPCNALSHSYSYNWY